MIYPDGSTFPPYWFGQMGDVYGRNCSFQYGTNFMPNTVFGEGCRFLGNTCNYCDPFITFTGPQVIGQFSTFYYCIFFDGPETVIGQPMIDMGENAFNGANEMRKNRASGAHRSSTSTCSQAQAGGKKKDPPCVHDQ